MAADSISIKTIVPNADLPDTKQSAENEQKNYPLFQIQRVYLKDISLEQPNSPAILQEAATPEIEVEIGITHDQLSDGIFECVLTATVTAKIQDKVLFLVEGKQAGIFEIRNVSEMDQEALLCINSPSILLPYLRAIIADNITRAGFPPIHLADISFHDLYNAHVEQAAREHAENNPNEPATNKNAAEKLH